MSSEPHAGCLLPGQAHRHLSEGLWGSLAVDLSTAIDAVLAGRRFVSPTGADRQSGAIDAH